MSDVKPSHRLGTWHQDFQAHPCVNPTFICVLIKASQRISLITLNSLIPTEKFHTQMVSLKKVIQENDASQVIKGRLSSRLPPWASAASISQTWTLPVDNWGTSYSLHLDIYHKLSCLHHREDNEKNVQDVKIIILWKVPTCIWRIFDGGAISLASMRYTEHRKALSHDVISIPLVLVFNTYWPKWSHTFFTSLQVHLYINKCWAFWQLLDVTEYS